jgi:hypothetical protein
VSAPTGYLHLIFQLADSAASNPGCSNALSLSTVTQFTDCPAALPLPSLPLPSLLFPHHRLLAPSPSPPCSPCCQCCLASTPLS